MFLKFRSTSSTSESPQKKEQWEKSEQKTKIMETVKLEGEKEIKKLVLINPLTPMSDQDRISPYNINTISSRQVMRIKKSISEGIIS